MEVSNNAYLHVGPWTRCFCMTGSHWAAIASFNSPTFFAFDTCHAFCSLSWLYYRSMSLSKRVSCTRVNWDRLITIRIHHSTSYDERVLAITAQFSKKSNSGATSPPPPPHTLLGGDHIIWGRSSCSKCMVTGSPICKSYFLACWWFGRLSFHVMVYSMKNWWVDVFSIIPRYL